MSIAKTTKGSSTRFTHEGPYQCIAYGEKELQVVSPSPFTRGPIYGGGGRPVKLHCYPRGLACSGGSSVHCQVGSVAYAGVDTRRDLTVWLPGRSKVGSLIYCVSSRLVLGPVRGWSVRDIMPSSSARGSAEPSPTVCMGTFCIQLVRSFSMRRVSRKCPRTGRVGFGLFTLHTIWD